MHTRASRETDPSQAPMKPGARAVFGQTSAAKGQEEASTQLSSQHGTVQAAPLLLC